MKNTMQICATVTREVAEEVEIIAKSGNRTFSKMVEILLQIGIKERTRKKKNTHKQEGE